MQKLVIFESPMVYAMAIAKFGNLNLRSIFLKHGGQNNLKDNGRKTDDQIKICEAMAKNFGLDLEIMEIDHVVDIISCEEIKVILIELKFLHNINILKNRISDNLKVEIIGITYAMDYLLASGNYLKNVINVYRVLNIFLWRRLLRDVKTSRFIFPYLSNAPYELQGKKLQVVSTEEWEFFLNKIKQGSFFHQLGAEEILTYGDVVYVNLPFMSKDWYESELDGYLNFIKNYIGKVNKLIIIKPHPGIIFDKSYARDYISKKCFEKGLQVVFMFEGLELAIPIEILIGIRGNNLFVGVPSGGVAFMNKKNVYFLSSHDKVYEKNTRLGYHEFLRRR